MNTKSECLAQVVRYRKMAATQQVIMQSLERDAALAKTEQQRQGLLGAANIARGYYNSDMAKASEWERRMQDAPQ